uniref:Uncharacterized protein n=1 Tax=Romanomermis culicivorax TaxID=13658 RepID=A0A915IQE2_ROMCU
MIVGLRTHLQEIYAGRRGLFERDIAFALNIKSAANKRAQVVNGIRMVRNLLDALNDRTTLPKPSGIDSRSEKYPDRRSREDAQNLKTPTLSFGKLQFQALCYSQCDNTFKSYLDCIASSTGDAVKGKALESEFADDYRKLVARSFDSTRTSSNQKCVLSDDELQTDIFGDNGPLHGFPEGQKIATDIKNQFFKASEDIRKCLRLEFAAAVVDEMQPCIAQKIGNPNFKVPELPDFDKNTQTFLDVVLRGVSYRVMAYSRLYACNAAFPDRATKTKALLDDKSGLFKLHCDLNKSCRSNVDNSCGAQFDKVKSATCSCMYIKRDDWHTKFDKVRDAIENFSTSSQCSSAIKDAVGGWRYKLQNAMKKCIPDKDNLLASIGIDKAIDKGCDELAGKSSDVRLKIVNAIRMIRNLLDALNDRITRFCEVRC